MVQKQKDFSSKSRHNFFFDLLDEAFLSLNQLKIIVIPTRGIEAVSSEFKFNNIGISFHSELFLQS